MLCFLIPDASGTLVSLVLHWYPTATPTIGISRQLVGPTCWPLLAAVCSVGERRVLSPRLRLISQVKRQVSEELRRNQSFRGAKVRMRRELTKIHTPKPLLVRKTGFLMHYHHDGLWYERHSLQRVSYVVNRIISCKVGSHVAPASL